MKQTLLRFMTLILVLPVSTVLLTPLQAADGPLRVFVTDSVSWQVSGGFGGNHAGGGTISGGARPQTAEIIKTFDHECDGVTVTINKSKADYIILLDHEGGKEFFRRDNKVAVFARNGDAVYTGSTRSLGNAVKDACRAILRHRGSSVSHP